MFTESECKPELLGSFKLDGQSIYEYCLRNRYDHLIKFIHEVIKINNDDFKYIE